MAYNRPGRSLFPLITALSLALPSFSLAGTFTAFGPQTFQRETGPPVTVSKTFTVLNPNTTYTLRINNGGLNADFARVSSAVITLNGVQVVGPNEFNQSVAVIEKPITLAAANTLAAELRSQPGSGITVQIIGVDNDPPTITASIDPPPNTFGWNNTDVTVTFTCSDATSGIATCPNPITVTTEGANQVVSGTAVDRAGNRASASVTLNIDKTPPVIAVISPREGTTNRGALVKVSGAVADANLIALLRVNGIDVGLENRAFNIDLSFQEGPQTIFIEAEDIAGNRSSASVNFVVAIPPVVTITSPPNLSTFGASPITVSGTIDDPTATVVVNGVPAAVSGGAFTAIGIPLREGSNIITATATDPRGNVGTSSITVALDTTPPTVLIDTPADGAIITQPVVTVTGMINDIVTGTVNGDKATVTVNGIEAQVSNRSFVVVDLPLKRGPNTITATGTDKAGNTSSHSIQVTFQELAGQRINLVSGNNQTGIIGTTLLRPLVASLTDANGSPVIGRSVTFTVSRGDGIVSSTSQQGRSLAVITDTAGQAGVFFTLGTRTGAGSHRVTATAVGFVGEATFCASATNSAATQIKTISGENQRGEVGQPLPQPFVVFAHDEGGNPVGGVAVSFKVTQGGGAIAGAPSFTALTDSDGRASAVLTLGPDPGINNNIVQGSFTGMTGLPATFTASGVIPGKPEETKVSGVVLDNSNIPIEGVTATIKGTTLRAVTNAQGQFTIDNVPVGALHLRVDGSTTTRPGTWPALEFEISTISGQDNTIGMPIYLLPLDADNSKIVGGSEDVTLTMKGVPGLSLTVFANSVTFRDGSRVGRVMVTQVHSDKVPMPPIGGAAPRLVWTVQPEGTIFNPPARITYPNLHNHPPGQVVDIFSFDHDLGQFVSVGTGTVSADGSVITSDPGVGIRKAGWGYPQPPPEPTTTADGPPSPIPGAINPVEGSTGELARQTNKQGDGRFSLEGDFRREKDPNTGELKPKEHTGVDVVGPIGTPIRATADGTVDFICLEAVCRTSGNQVIIDHGNGLFSRYFHLNEINVKKGQAVLNGQQIGTLGTTGNAAGTDQPHLHFEVRQGSRTGKALDPTGIVQQGR